jgi:protein SCO1/2
MKRGYLAAVRVTISAVAATFCSAAVLADDASMIDKASATVAMPETDVQQATQTSLSTVPYSAPQLKLIRQDGKSVSLADEMDDGRPVVLNFIFTTCGSICPLMSQVFGQFQRQLGNESGHVHLMSISTDPEEDSPPRLREYARRYGARPGWNHYTGTLEASQSAQRAFGVYRGDKMSHTPVTLMRIAPGQPWLRIEGFVTPQQLLAQYQHLLAAR